MYYDVRICNLPPEYGDQGSVTFLEDCPVRGHLSRFYILPRIAKEKKGVHPRVCCPEYLSPSAICTASDPWCPTYEVSCTVYTHCKLYRD